MKRIAWICAGNVIGGLLIGGLVFAVPRLLNVHFLYKLPDFYFNPLGPFLPSLPFFAVNFLIKPFRQQIRESPSSFFISLGFFAFGIFATYLVAVILFFGAIPEFLKNAEFGGF